MMFLQSVTQAYSGKKAEFSEQESNRPCPVTSPNALPLSYGRLKRAHAIKLSSNKIPAVQQEGK